MSNCRDSYCNYGSYLRSRGYDKQICKLVDDIENGNINNGAVNPNSNGNGAVVNGSLIVKSAGQANPPPSNSRMQEGLIYSFGGQLGSSGEFINNYDLGMQMYNGTRINGPIIQTANNSHVKATAQGSSVVTHVNTNIFKGDTHIFTNDGADTNVIIKGNLSFDGSLVQLPDTIETSLTLQAPATHNNEMLKIFHGATEAQGFDIVDVWIDGSGNIVPPSGPPTGTKNWLQRLAFAIDGDLSANQFTTGGYNGATAVHGHTRILRGATVLNPCHDPSTDNTIDISYSLNDISDVALDVYGRVRVFEGPTYNGLVKSAPEIDLSGSSVNAAKISMYNDGSLTLNLNANDGIISGNSSGDGIKIRDVSNIRFLDNTEIFAGNSLDISSDKVEFLHGDVHIVENLSVSGNVITAGSLNAFTAAAIDTLNVETKLACNGDASFNDNVTIGNNLQIDGALQVGSSGTGNILGTIQTPNQPNITSVGTLTSVDINGGAIDGTVIGANSAVDGTFDTITANNASISTITNAALTNPTITGGAIDGATIGASTPNTGAFTTLSATSLSAPAPATLGITGNLTGDVTGNVSGNAGTATALQNARNIGGVSFDGTADIDLPGVNTAGNQNTSGQAGSVVNGVYTTGNQTIGGNKTFSSTISGSIDGNAGTVTNGVYTTGNQTIAGNKTFTGGSNIYTGSNIEVNTATFSNSLTIGDGVDEFFDVDSGTKIVKIGNKPNSNYSDLVFPGTVTGHDVTVTNTNGLGVLNVSGGAGLKVQKFGLGVTPEETLSSGDLTGTHVNKRNGGTGSTIYENSKFKGDYGSSDYSIGQIVQALKKFGILEQ